MSARDPLPDRSSTLPAGDCPASMEAVHEYEVSHGDQGCPLCWRDALDHRLEDPLARDQNRKDSDA